MYDYDEPMPSEKERLRRLESHKASKAHRGPCPGMSVRESLRSRHGYDATAKLIRAIYDGIEKPRKRRDRQNKKPA